MVIAHPQQSPLMTKRALEKNWGSVIREGDSEWLTTHNCPPLATWDVPSGFRTDFAFLSLVTVYNALGSKDVEGMFLYVTLALSLSCYRDLWVWMASQ